MTIPAAIGILWRWILNYKYGIVNFALQKIGIEPIAWLGDVNYVRWSIIIVVIWSMVSYYTIIMLAAMQGISKSYYEAARIDGANNRQLFSRITLPMLSPMIFFSVIMVTIGILQIFDFIYLMVDRKTLSYTYSMSLVTYFYDVRVQQEQYARLRRGNYGGSRHSYYDRHNHPDGIPQTLGAE